MWMKLNRRPPAFLAPDSFSFALLEQALTTSAFLDAEDLDYRLECLRD